MSSAIKSCLCENFLSFSFSTPSSLTSHNALQAAKYATERCLHYSWGIMHKHQSIDTHAIYEMHAVWVLRGAKVLWSSITASNFFWVA